MRAPAGQGWFHLAAAAILLAGIAPGRAGADQSDSFNFATGGTLTHDSNVLRVPASSSTGTGVHNPLVADTIRSVYGGVRIDKPYAQQRFQLDYTKTRTRFDILRARNSDTTDYRTAWLWYLTPRMNGSLDADQSQSLVEGSESQGAARNLRTNTSKNFSLDGNPFGGWHLLLGASQKEQKSESTVTTSPDFRSVEARAGVQYKARSGDAISMIQYDRRGEYTSKDDSFTTITDRNYTERESEIKFNWKPSGKSSVTGRAAWLARRHERNPLRNFSGPVGGLDYNLAMTAKTTIVASVKRSMTATFDPLSSYRVENTLSFTPKLQMSEKTSLQLRLDYSTVDFRGPIVAPQGPLRRDVLRSAVLSATWDITRTASLIASATRQRRWSNDPNFVFEATVLSVTAKLTF